ncbi:MAG TPA: aminotransferase class I/II-fold pyridoxal phosphate-dependent enzyme [Spirochaetia bacterium]|nr:aminotransferase class I/II-fold pyridoxal phosphate-dependent enzyme [Spirochaetia bacterium]
MNQLAQELNKILEGTVIADLLSDYGKRFYFPKGIAAQSAEAKKHATVLNATIGMAYLNGEPVEHTAVRKQLPELVPDESVAYAPTGGDAALRARWKQEILRKNPDLSPERISEPMVVPGLTSGISQLADLFADKGDPVVIPDMFWGNYRLIFEGRREAVIHSFPFFTPDLTLNVEGLQDSLRKNAKNGKVILVINFPNNPTGYSPTKAEAARIVEALRRLAEEGLKIVAITDDAYFGLFYEKEIFPQSLFTPLSQAHENILAVKVDGATKEDFVWGFRIGFVTFGGKGLSQEHYKAINNKLMGSLRASISNSSRPAQSILLKAMESKGYEEEKQHYFDSLTERYQAVKRIIAERKTGLSLKPLPFNSGYFMSFEFEGGNAEVLRQNLLFKKGIGTISIADSYLRVAYSSIDMEDMERLYTEIFASADEIVVP